MVNRTNMSARTLMNSALALMIPVVVGLAALPIPASGITADEAIAVYQAGEYRVAAERFERLKEERPQEPGIRYYLGYAYYKLGNLERSRAEFLEAYRLDPRFSPRPPH